MPPPPSARRSLQQALEAVHRALELEPLSAQAHQMRSTVLFQLGQFKEFELAGRLAIKLNPGNPDRLMFLGSRLFCMGRFDEGAELLWQAFSMYTYMPRIVFIPLIWDFCRRGQYREADEFASPIPVSSDFYLYHVAMVALCDKLGRPDRVEKHIAALLALRPDYASEFADDFAVRMIHHDVTSAMASGLRRGGLTVPHGIFDD